MTNWKTTAAGVLVGVSGLSAALAMYLKSGTLDFLTISTAVGSILGALGLTAAADAGKK